MRFTNSFTVLVAYTLFAVVDAATSQGQNKGRSISDCIVHSITYFT